MTFRSNDEFLNPEHLSELSALFDHACATLAIPTGSEAHDEQRTRLASILLQLFALRQLGADQVTQLARRLLRPPAQEAAMRHVDLSAAHCEPPAQLRRTDDAVPR